jgi:hypothetical protein
MLTPLYYLKNLFSLYDWDDDDDEEPSSYVYLKQSLTDE